MSVEKSLHHAAANEAVTDGPVVALTGVVVIGRNEGDRLTRCLASIGSTTSVIVYVDSGSSDGSPMRAAAAGAVVHPLDLARPFTAARARNEGVLQLQRSSSLPDFTQFIDGDC